MKAKVLVIDDEKTFRMVAEAALLAEGYQFEAAATGRAGLERARQFGPDVVVLDVHLPDISGVEISRRVLEPWCEVEVIAPGEYVGAITAESSDECAMPEWCTHAGTSDATLAAVTCESGT